jgi:hypothetical protein
MKPGTVRWLPFALGVVLAGLAALQDHLASGLPFSWPEALKLVGGAMVGYAFKRFGDLTSGEAEEKAKAAVEDQLTKLSIVPDEPRTYD